MYDSACIFICHCSHGSVRNFSSSPYTPPSCTCHLISLIISLIIIHQNFHPIVTCSFICTELSVPVIQWGLGLLNQPSLVYRSLLITTPHNPQDLSSINHNFIPLSPIPVFQWESGLLNTDYHWFTEIVCLRLCTIGKW